MERMNGKQQQQQQRWWWWDAIDQNDAVELRRLCSVHSLVPFWHRDTAEADCNPLGWAIMRRSPLVCEIIKYGDPRMLIHKCYVPKNGPSFHPHELATEIANTHAVALLKHVGIASRMSFLEQERFVMERNCAERARYVALMLINARKNHDAFQGVPRDIIWLIARAVYATRTEVDVWW